MEDDETSYDVQKAKSLMFMSQSRWAVMGRDPRRT